MRRKNQGLSKYLQIKRMELLHNLQQMPYKIQENTKITKDHPAIKPPQRNKYADPE